MNYKRAISNFSHEEVRLSPPRPRLLSLQIDMQLKIVHASSRPSCVGLRLADLLPTGGTRGLESAFWELSKA